VAFLLLAWTAGLLFGAVLLAYGSLLLYMVVRRARRGVDLDQALLRIRLVRRRMSPAGYLDRLERQIVWGVLAAGALDVRRRFLWLPNTVEVLVAPADLHALGRAAKQLHDHVLKRLRVVAQTSPCRFRTRPVILLIEDATCPPGRPALRLGFTEATEQAPRTDIANHNGTRIGSVTTLRHAYLHPLHPPGPPMLLRSGHRFYIGRLSSCDLVLQQPAVSRRHAVVYEGDGAWWVADAGSTNGTFVNLMPAVEPVRLSDSDEIRLGEAVRVRFELQSNRHRLRWGL